MYRLPLYLLLTVTTGYTLPMLASSEAMPDDAPAAVAAAAAAEVKVTITGRINLAADRGRRVPIELLASPKLTATAQTLLVSSGFELVDTHERADVVYKLDGAFQVLRSAIRRIAEVRVDDYAENPASLATRSGRDDSVILSLNPLTMLIGTIASNTGNAAGAQNPVNVTTVGDPNGKCLSRCETWCYRQRNIVNLTRREGSTEQKCSALATTEDTELVPARLIQPSPADLQEVAGLTMTLGLSADPALAK